MDELNRDELKQEANDLGIKYAGNISTPALKEKIDEYYSSQETSGKEILAAVEANSSKEKSEEKSVVSDKHATIAKLRAAANETKVVTIIDNDQRVNNKTTSCTVNCSNMYFDLGTMILPLGIPVEVRQGHLNVLKEVKIPQHAIDPKTGLSTVRMIPRYTISYGIE